MEWKFRSFLSCSLTIALGVGGAAAASAADPEPEVAAHEAEAEITVETPASVSGESAGQLVDVGGRKLKARVVGEGEPAIVLDTGMGNSMEIWGELPERLAEMTTVVVYDRAGLGGSELGPEPRDAAAVAQDLRALLRALEVEPPYLLVGHSLGGLHIRAYADLEPEKIAGLVFLDPTTEGMLESLGTEEGQADVMRQLEGESEGVLAEARGVHASLGQIEKIGSPPDVPALIFTAMEPPVIPEEYREAADGAGLDEKQMQELMQMKVDLHAALTARLPQGKQIFALHSQHYVQVEEPDLVVREIVALVEAIRER